MEWRIKRGIVHINRINHFHDNGLLKGMLISLLHIMQKSNDEEVSFSSARFCSYIKVVD